MKILYRDLKHGVIKVRVENLDDLWYLSGVLMRGDIVKTKTERRIKSKGDVIREKSKREKVTLGLEIESVEFSDDNLRVSGKIKEGPEDLVSLGTYHTFNIRKGFLLKIIKEKFSEIELQRLREAEKAALRPKILILVIEDGGDATIGLVRETKVELYDISKAIGGKYDDLKGRKKRKDSFYTEISNFILEILSKEENISGMVISGPGFEQENFHKFFLEKYPKLRKKTFLEKISSGGRTGIKEVIQRPIMKKISEELNSAREIQLTNKLLEEIGKDSGLGIYGLKEIEVASETGAIELLLVNDDFFLKNRKKVERILHDVKNKSGKFHLINHKNEPGQQLDSLGGIAAILRFKVFRS